MSMKPLLPSGPLSRRVWPAALAAALLCAALVPPPAAFAQSPKARFSGEPVTLNFVNAEIEGVARQSFGGRHRLTTERRTERQHGTPCP